MSGPQAKPYIVTAIDCATNEPGRGVSGNGSAQAGTPFTRLSAALRTRDRFEALTQAPGRVPSYRWAVVDLRTGKEVKG